MQRQSITGAKWLALVLLGAQMLVLSAGTAAKAQEFDGFPIAPTYYRVSGVASNDVLNIRAAPDSDSQILGSLAPHAAPVEVFVEQNGWAQVAMAEGMGWVSAAFLQEIDVARLGESGIPVGLACGGTEPFWGLNLDENGIRFSQMGQNDEILNYMEIGGYQGRVGPDGFVQASNQTKIVTGMISVRQCSDGMSDRDYGWWINLLVQDGGGVNAITGCCQLPSAQ